MWNGCCPDCKVGSQRIVCALGLLLGRVAAVGREPALDAGGETFVPDLCSALRAVFAHLRTEVAGTGVRDVERILRGGDACRKVLRMLGTRPSLRSQGASSSTVGPAFVPCGGKSASASNKLQGVLRVATWNIAGGKKSAQAPEKWSPEDQRGAVVLELSLIHI